MAPVIIPLVPSIPLYQMIVTLAGNDYIFDVRWNARSQGWYFDLYEINETPIAFGLKIVGGTYIGRRFKHSLFKYGAFVAFDTQAKGRAALAVDPTFDDLGTRVQLRYYTDYDIIAAVRAAHGMG